MYSRSIISWENKKKKNKNKVGNTSIGVIRQYDPPHPNDSPKVYIDVAAIPELNETTMTDGGLVIGASVTIARLINALKVKKKKILKCERDTWYTCVLFPSKGVCVSPSFFFIIILLYLSACGDIFVPPSMYINIYVPF